MPDIRALLPERFHAALAALLTSFDYAQDAGSDSWQFALDLPELLSAGATVADLRWLIHRGFAEHAKETTIPGDNTRSFRRLAPTSFPPDCCIVLSPAGADALRPLLASASLPPPLSKGGPGGVGSNCSDSLPCATDAMNAVSTNNPPLSNSGQARLHQPASTAFPPLRKGRPGGVGSNCLHGSACTDAMNAAPTNTSPPSQGGAKGGLVQSETSTPLSAPSALLPHYDAMLHELRLGDEIVKRFTRPAPAQELILAAFQEDGWPPAIDDPLTAQFNQDPKRHLHYTVRNLNRGQKPLRIRFYINGNGETIRWLIVPLQRATGARRARKQRK